MQTRTRFGEDEFMAIILWLHALPDNLLDMEPVSKAQEKPADEWREEDSRIELWLQVLPENISELEPVVEPYQEDESGSNDCTPDTVQKWPTLPEDWPRHLAYHPAMYLEETTPRRLQRVCTGACLGPTV